MTIAFSCSDQEVLEKLHGLLAFEIKRSSRISKKDLNGLKSFASNYPKAKLYMLYGGSRQEYTDNISILPAEKALKELPIILKNS